MRKIPLFLSIIVAASMILGKTAFAAPSSAVRTPVGPAVQTAPVSANADAPRKAFIASADKFAVIGPQNILYNSDSADAVQMKTAVTAAVEDWYSRLNMTIDGHMVSLYTAQFNPSMRIRVSRSPTTICIRKCIRNTGRISITAWSTVLTFS
jgi:hypothetical protein